MNITAKDLFCENGQLKHKLRTESDLIRHIQTREAEMANYCLFLGAGASVTSDIRAAGTLIDEWLLELYERFKDKTTDDVAMARDYFTKHHASWYNPSNPYSSLFEKKYDLPSQRRRFIEMEVDEKLPSIGYAYLTSLCDSNFFNTVFTTNFDDLLNEAFYQFSSKRPISCAHDSSIHSISITSKRPKIIKLHGDYLFDDIKSTLRETESLEHNTKEKLKEFCKEFGLIFIGYAGNDRSIMDVLEYLIKQENYLKNGIYWCFRKNDVINHTLRNLLWKEKIYPVIIDGFDEFFAKVHKCLFGRGLDLGSTAKNSKLQITIQKIISDEYKLSSNQIIKNEIKQIADSNSRHDISSFINDLSKDDDSELPLPDLRNLLEVEDYLNKKELPKAYELCERYYLNANLNIAKSKYLSKLMSIAINMEDRQRAIHWSDRLIELDPNNLFYSFKKADCLIGLKDEYEYLINLLEQHKYRFEIYNKIASTGFHFFKNNPGSSGIALEELIDKLNISLKLNPSLSNYAWRLKIRIL